MDSLITTIWLVVSRSWPLVGWMTALIPITTSVYYQFVNLFAKLMESAGSELIDSGIPQSVITCFGYHGCRGRDVINRVLYDIEEATLRAVADTSRFPHTDNRALIGPNCGHVGNSHSSHNLQHFPALANSLVTIYSNSAQHVCLDLPQVTLWLARMRIWASGYWRWSFVHFDSSGTDL